MRYAHSFRTIATVLAVGLSVGVAVPVVAQITEDNVGEMVQKATTAADHTALADYFRAQAKVASASAKKHVAMRPGGDPKSSRGVWDAHCQRLIKSFEEEAHAFEDLAKEQDTLAKHATTAH